MTMTYLILCYLVVYLDLFGLEADLFVRPLQPPLSMDRSTIIFWWAQHWITRAYRIFPWDIFKIAGTSKTYVKCWTMFCVEISNVF